MITTSLELALLVLCVEFGLIAVVIMFVSRQTERQQQNTAVENVTSLVATVEKTESIAWTPTSRRKWSRISSNASARFTTP